MLQPAPAFSNDDAVGGIFWIVANGSRPAQAGGINQRGPLEECEVLGALITDAGDVVAIHQRTQIAGVGLLRPVENGTVNDAAMEDQMFAAQALAFFRGLAMREDPPEDDAAHGSDGGCGGGKDRSVVR